MSNPENNARGIIPAARAREDSSAIQGLESLAGCNYFRQLMPTSGRYIGGNNTGDRRRESPRRRTRRKSVSKKTTPPPPRPPSARLVSALVEISRGPRLAVVAHVRRARMAINSRVVLKRLPFRR